jgi:hypothetical protein
MSRLIVILRRCRAVLVFGLLFLVGMAVTVAAFAFIPPASEFWPVLVLPVWWIVLFGGTRVLPSSVTLPYDPVGHPALWWIGIVANAVYVAGLAYGSWLVARRIARTTWRTLDSE